MEDVKNLDQLYKNNYTTVYSFIYNITFDKALTEDITQEAFIRAYNHMDSLRNESKISVWLIDKKLNSYKYPVSFLAPTP
jgi:RNA polymerase sigma-70 factor, ECF subfamily